MKIGFGTRGSLVQIQSPRPIFSSTSERFAKRKRAAEGGKRGRGFPRVSPDVLPRGFRAVGSWYVPALGTKSMSAGPLAFISAQGYAPPLASRLGLRFPTCWSAAGRVFLASAAPRCKSRISPDFPGFFQSNTLLRRLSAAVASAGGSRSKNAMVSTGWHNGRIN